MHCPICTSDHVCSVYKLYDDRYGCPGEYSLLSCIDCGHLFIRHTFTSEEIGQLYTRFYPESIFSSDTPQTPKTYHALGNWLNGINRSAYRWIPPRVTVLDIGCGAGGTLAYHGSRGCDAYGVEANENARKIAEKFGYKIQIGLFDPKLYEPGFFDYVTMDQVIEHMIDPIETLQGVRTVLKSKGQAILSTPNPASWARRLFGRRWINWHAPYHLHHFTERSMTEAARRAGFVLEGIKTITSSEWLRYQWAHLLTYPNIGHPSPFWSAQAVYTTTQKYLLKSIGAMHLFRINHFFTRLFDTLGLGDNHIFFLRKQ